MWRISDMWRILDFLLYISPRFIPNHVNTYNYTIVFKNNYTNVGWQYKTINSCENIDKKPFQVTQPNKGIKQGNYIIEQDGHWRQQNTYNRQNI